MVLLPVFSAAFDNRLTHNSLLLLICCSLYGEIMYCWVLLLSQVPHAYVPLSFTTNLSTVVAKVIGSYVVLCKLSGFRFYTKISTSVLAYIFRLINSSCSTVLA